MLSAGEAVVLAVLAGVVLLAVRSILKGRKSNSCCGDCGKCRGCGK